MSLRGGGACASQRPTQSVQVSTVLVSNQFDSILQSNVQIVFKNAEDAVSNYKEINQALQSLLSLDFELNNLTHSQNQLSKQVTGLEKALTSLLESCLVLNNQQLKSMALNFASKLSRTIFWHYCQAKSIKDGLQQSYITLLNKIENQNNQDDNFYKNLIEFSVTICKMIFTILPNDFQEGLEIIAMFTSVNQILMNTLNKTMKETIKGGIVQSIRDATKVQYRKIYKQIYNIDTIKWWVITELRQQTHTVKEILFELQDFQKELSKADYYVQLSWVNAISQIVSHAPQISDDLLNFESEQIQELVDMKSLTKMRDDYKVTLNYHRLKSTQSQALREKLPQLASFQTVQEQIICREKFFNKLYNNQEEAKELAKPEQQIKGIFQYLFSLFMESEIEINIDQIRKVNQQYTELNENITLIKQISLSKWIKMCEQKSFSDSVVFGEFEQKQKQVKHLLSQAKGITKFLIQLDFIFSQWDIVEKIVEDDSKQQNSYAIFQENKQNYLDCQQIAKMNIDNLNQLQLLSIQFDVYFQVIKEFIDKQYQQVHAVVQTTQSTDPILTLYKQYKDVQDIVQACFRKVNDKILFFKDIFMHISEQIKQIEANCILKFYNVSLKLQHIDVQAPYFEYRNQDHQALFFIQNYERSIIINSLQFLHKEFKDMVTNSQFQDYEQAKLYLRSILLLCSYIEGQMNQNKKLMKHFHNYKHSISIENETVKYNELLNQWNYIQQIITTLEQQQFDQAVFLSKFSQLQERYDAILKLNAQIRWPFNQYITQYFQMIAQLDLIFQELKTYQQFDANSDANALSRYENLRRNLKQISQSQIQRIKSTLEQYTQAVDTLQIRLETLNDQANDELLNNLIIMQEAINETLNLIQARMAASQSQSIGSINLIQNQRLPDFENLYNFKITSEVISISSFIKFNYNFIEKNAIIEGIKLDQSGSTNQHVVQLGYQSESLRIVMITNLFDIWNCCLGEQEFQIISQLIIQIRLNETSNIIKKELKSTYKPHMEPIISATFNDQTKYIEQDLKQRIRERNQLSFQIKYEPSFENSQLLSEKFQQQTQDIQNIFMNLQELEQEFKVSVPFYQQLLSEFKKADQSTSTVDLSEINFFQGRQLTELFLLRMDHIQRQIKTHQIKNTYIDLECSRKGEIKMLFPTKENRYGLVDKFLEDTQMHQLLLLHGDAGSGKSVAIRMIEDFIWKRNDAIKIIPIVVRLSELKDPINNAIVETLRSLNYKLDNSHIEQLQKDVKANKMQVLFIFEEYDKLSQDQININLFKSNNLIQWRTPNLTNSPKFILVTRSELFQFEDHLRWINDEDEEYNYKNYWNVRILPFEAEQKNQFLAKFQELSVRMTALEFYSIMCDFEHQDLLVQNFIQVWKKIEINLNDQSVDNALLTQNLIIKIVAAFKTDSKIKYLDDIIFQTLSTQLEQLKSNNYFQRMLQTLNFYHQIDNPQNLMILVSTLPKLLQTISGAERVKQDFYEIYLNENYALYTDTKLAKVQLDRDWNQLANSQFFKFYKAEEAIPKTQILLAQCFGEDPQYQNKILKVFEKMTITHYDLYEQYITNYFEIATIRMQITQPSISTDRWRDEQWNFSINLAQKFSNHELFSVHYNSQGSLIKIGGQLSDWEEFFNDDDCLINSFAIPKKLLRKAVPLREQFSIFAFENKIIQEFLVAKAIINQIESKKSIEQAFHESILKVKNISIPFFHGTVNFFVEKCKKKFTIKQRLIEIVKSSANSGDNIILASNAFYLLLKLDEKLKGVDLSNIRIRDIHLDECHLINCNLSNSTLANVSVGSLALIQNNQDNMNFSEIKLNSYSTKNKNQNPKCIRQFKSGFRFVVYQNQVVNENGNIMLSSNLSNSSVIQLEDTYFIVTPTKLYYARQENDFPVISELDVPNIISISKFDFQVILFQLEGQTQAKILELDLESHQVTHSIKISEQDIKKYCVQQFFYMQGNQLLFLTQNSQVQTVHFQIENDQVVLDNLSTHLVIQAEDPIKDIKYFSKLDITVVTFEDPVLMKNYEIIYGTINQLAGRFIELADQKNQFLYLNQNKLQLINQETLKVTSQCEIKIVKSEYQQVCQHPNKNILFLIFKREIVVLSLAPFEVVKIFNICAIDALVNINENSLQVLTEFELVSYDLKYLLDRHISITNDLQYFDDIVFVQSSANFLAKINNSSDIVIATISKKNISYRVIAKMENPEKIFLSNDENYAILKDNDLTLIVDLKNNTQLRTINFPFEKILWIKDNENFFFYNQGYIEEYQNSVITVRNKIQPIQQQRQILSVQSVDQKLYVHTNSKEVVVIKEDFTQEILTSKQIIKKYLEYYTTPHDLRFENNRTITIIYKSQNMIVDFWVYQNTILIREQEEGTQMSVLVLIDKKTQKVIEQLLISIDFIEYTEDQIQVISNKTFWQSFSSFDLMVLQSQILSSNTMLLTSNNLDQLMIVSTMSEITIWNTTSFKVVSTQKYAELIQTVKMIPKKQNEFYVADRDVLKLFVQNQMKFSLQLNKKRIKLLMNDYNSIHYIYQVEEDKITLNCVQEDQSIEGWKKVIYEIDSQRVPIECLDSKDHRLVYFGGSCVSQVFLDAFDDVKSLEIPSTFKCQQIKYNKDCSQIYIRQNEKIVIIESQNLTVINQVVLNELFSKPFPMENQIEIFGLGLNNLLIKTKKKNYYLLYNYSITSQKMDLISHSYYSQFVGVNSQGLVVVDRSSSAIDLYYPKIIDPSTNFVTYALQQSYNKSNLARFSFYDNQVTQCKIISHMGVDIGNLQRIGEEDDLLISF